MWSGPGCFAWKCTSFPKPPPFTVSDAAKAALAEKTDFWSKNDAGDIDAYSKCGEFAHMFVAPFFALAAALFLTWAFVQVAFRGLKWPFRVTLSLVGQWNIQCGLRERASVSKVRGARR